MASGDLVSLATFQTAMASSGFTLTAAQNAWAPSAITAASRAIERYCARLFTSTAYDEIRQPMAGQFDRNEPDSVTLRYPPVALVSRVSSGRTTALSIANTATTTNQRAFVALNWTGDPEIQATATGITLSTVASGTLTATTLAFSSYATVQLLANAIVALGAGWTATVSAGMGNWPTLDAGGTFSELIGPVGPQGCLGGSGQGARLDVFSVDLQAWDFDSSNGVVFLSPQGGAALSGPGAPWLFGVTDPLDGIISGAGAFRAPVRILYTGGYTTIPLGVQQAACETVKAMLERLATDTTLSGESDGPYSYQAVAVESLAVIPRPALQALSLYRIYRA